MKPRAKFGKVTSIVAGKAYRYSRRKNGASVIYTVCCDCGLVHLEEMIPRDRYIRVRVWRDDERTKVMRGRRRIVGKK